MKHYSARHTLALVAVSLLTALAMNGCQKMIDFDYDDIDPLVVVYSNPVCGEPVSVRLTYSRFFLASGDYEVIDNATLRLEVNGTVLPEVPAFNDSVVHGHKMYNFSYQPQADDTLTLYIHVPASGKHEAKDLVCGTRMPKAPQLTDVAATVSNLNVYTTTDYSFDVALRFTLVDDADVQNYYSVTTSQLDSLFCHYDFGSGRSVDTVIVRRSLFYFTCNDPLLTGTSSISDVIDDDEYASMNFSDENINGRSHVITLSGSDFCNYYIGGVWDSVGSRYVRPTITARNYIELSVGSINRDKYLFDQTSAASTQDFSFFSEPTQIHSNVQGGIGVMAGSTNATFLVPLPVDDVQQRRANP